ncbi:hypothetical protein Scep_011459 [Stephania cephalantha]|uniref:Uncharacterized protein n=1 Tax=Stephania cephalantha TaxID=152367 RepID=A0AAP0JD41_9MAGN
MVQIRCGTNEMPMFCVVIRFDEERLALEEIGEIGSAAEDLVLVDEENGVPSEGGIGRDVAVVEEGDQKGGLLEGITGNSEGLFGVGGFGAPGFGPEGVAGYLEGDGSDGEVEGGAELEAGGGGGAPVEEAGGDGEASGEYGAEVEREGEAELGLGAGEFGVGEAGENGDGGVAEVGDDFVGEVVEGGEAGRGGEGGGGGGGGCSGGEAAEAGDVGRCQAGHSPVSDGQLAVGDCKWWSTEAVAVEEMHMSMCIDVRDEGVRTQNEEVARILEELVMVIKGERKSEF